MTPRGQGGEGADDGPGPGPPHPDDRLWRHPSELSAALGSAGPAGSHGAWLRSPEARSLGRPALSVLAGVLVGAALATAGVVLVGNGGGTGDAIAGRALAGGGAPGPGGGLGGAGVGVVPTASTASTAAVGPMLAAPVAQLASQVVRVAVERAGTSTWGCGLSEGSQGLVVTAAALVQGSTELSVTGAGGDRALATLVGSDPMTGVAVLRFTSGSGGGAGSGAAAAPEGPAPRPGDVVLALGMSMPGGAGGARLSMGEVTAVGVNTLDANDDPVLDAIATDLPMDGTGLGAPVVDSRGRVLGMVVSAGAGRPTLAVPIGTARRAAASLAASGSVAHGWMGVEQGVTTGAGLAIAQLAPASPASRAGLAPGDVIVAVDGQAVHSMEDLAAHVGLAAPGQAVVIEVSRPPRHWSVRVVLGAVPGS